MQTTGKGSRVIIVIPVYKAGMSDFEERSFVRCVSALREFDICLIAPEHLDLTTYTNLASVSVKKYPSSFFADLTGYNRLLLSSFFYEDFNAYKYMLIHQLDCYILKNELTYWCALDYDYIGAPWLAIEWFPRICKKIANMILRRNSRLARPMIRFTWWRRGLRNANNLNVGNGGFSLRRIKVCQEMTKRFEREAGKWELNEDYFWSIFVPLSTTGFRIPPWKEAMNFSFDINPKICFELNDRKIPFGCHAWYRNDHPYHDNLDFWLPIINGTSETVTQ